MALRSLNRMNCWDLLPVLKLEFYYRRTISSQALQACEEGSETRWFAAISACNTPLASDVLFARQNGDIVHTLW